MSHKFWRMINKILFSEYSFFVYFFPNLRNSSVLSCYWCLVQFNARTEGELLDFSRKMIRDKHMQNVCDKITSFAEYSKITGRNGMFSNFCLLPSLDGESLYFGLLTQILVIERRRRGLWEEVDDACV